MTAVTGLESALAIFRAIAEQGDEQERALADRLTTFIRAADRERRRARLAGTRMLRQARRYKAAAILAARMCNMGTEITKATCLRVCEAIGNGDADKGRAMLEAIARRLGEAREKHPAWSEGPYYALGVIHSEFLELERAVEHETEDRQRDEALDVIATAIRFLGEEYK